MGFLAWLANAIRPRRLEDPVFGSLLYMPTPTGGYWEGKGPFDPVGHDVEWSVEAGEAGPTAREREFLQSLKNRFPELVTRIRPAVIESMASWEDEPKPADSFAEKLGFIGFPDLNKTPLEWELTFEGSEGRLFTAVLRDWDLELVRVDD